ncbi:MAG: gliding motility protein GldN [Taibaiella sp.]|nr:gliding motility protein GldN [Taibaiella sp.]
MKLCNAYRATIVSAMLLGSVTAFCQGVPATGQTSDAAREVIASPVNDKWLPSLAPPESYNTVAPGGAAIPYQPIRSADVLWKKTVWREVDMQEKQNIPFRYEGDENTGGGMFIEILVDAIKRGKVTPYESDDRLTTKLTKEQVLEKITPKPQEFDVQDVDGEIIHRVVTRDFDPHNVTKLRIKEEWVFDRNQGKKVAKIIAIAPVLDVINETDGTYRGSFAICWLSYPQVRQVLAGYEVYSEPNNANRPTWEDFFERRMFASRITKVSNPFNERYEDIYGTDARGKMEALYEGKNYAEAVFNQEHDKWEY